MPRVSLILPTIPGDPRPDGSVPALRSALERAGHEPEVIVANGPGAGEPSEGADWWTVVATDPGLASAAMAGLEAASGDVLVVIDPRMGYSPDSVLAVVAPLAEGRADLAIGSRRVSGANPGPLSRRIGQIARPFTGSTDPFSGLVGVTRAALNASFHDIHAVGSKYALELLEKIRGRRIDVPTSPSAPLRRDLPDWNDLRHLKRLADHRYGNMSRLIQFCFVGASGMVVDLTCYYLFQKVFDRTPLAGYSLPGLGATSLNLALATARASAIAVALVWNFSLNRRLTFSYARKGSLPRQFAAYVASNLLGVMVSMTLSLGLPERVPFFARHKLAAAVVGIVAATGISFSMARWVVFRRRSEEDTTKPEAGAGRPSGLHRTHAAVAAERMAG